MSILCSNWPQLSRMDQSSGTTAGVYALPAVQSKLCELRRRLAPLALCPSAGTDNTVRCQNKSSPRRPPLNDVRNHSRVIPKRTPRSFQSRNLTEVSVFCSVLPHFRYSSVETHRKSDLGVPKAKTDYRVPKIRSPASPRPGRI